MSYPLVTIGIMTYNSGKTVLDTLESAFEQSYDNLELIISDDCSKDNTVALCEEWLSTHSDRFVRTRLLMVQKNTGTSGNCNRIVREAKGDYIKILAGDDIFFRDCIKVNLENIGSSDMMISQYLKFDGDTVYEYVDNVDYKQFCSLAPEKRVHYYARTAFFCNVPTLFYKKTLFDNVGMFEEKLPLLEDTPFLLKVFASSSIVSYLPVQTIKYRAGGISKFSIKFEHILDEAFFQYRIHYLDKRNRIDRQLIRERKLYSFLLNHSSLFYYCVRYYYSRLNFLYKYIRKRIFSFDNL